MTLIAILIATLGAGIGSVWLAAGLMRLRVLEPASGAAGLGAQHLLSLAAGALLATAFMHLLPEAFESQAGAKALFATLLVGLVFFFLLDKAELWHHGHEHHHEHGHGHGHDHGAHDHAGPGQSGAWAVLTGDSVHCFGDGILIASAFVADLGAWAAVQWQAMGAPGPVLLIEAGPGRGTLMSDALRARSVSPRVPGGAGRCTSSRPQPAARGTIPGRARCDLARHVRQRAARSVHRARERVPGRAAYPPIRVA